MASAMKPVFKFVTYSCGHKRLESNPTYRTSPNVCPVCEEFARAAGIRVSHNWTPCNVVRHNVH